MGEVVAQFLQVLLAQYFYLLAIRTPGHGESNASIFAIRSPMEKSPLVLDGVGLRRSWENYLRVGGIAESYPRCVSVPMKKGDPQHCGILVQALPCNPRGIIRPTARTEHFMARLRSHIGETARFQNPKTRKKEDCKVLDEAAGAGQDAGLSAAGGEAQACIYPQVKSETSVSPLLAAILPSSRRIRGQRVTLNG